MKRFALLLCCQAMLLVLLAVPAQPALMDYTVNFTAWNFESIGSEPVPMDPVSGFFVYSWDDDTLDYSTATLKIFHAVLGAYVPTISDVGAYFSASGNFLIGGLLNGTNVIHAGTDDFALGALGLLGFRRLRRN